jgi:hypothetical protein
VVVAVFGAVVVIALSVWSEPFWGQFSFVRDVSPAMRLGLLALQGLAALCVGLLDGDGPRPRVTVVVLVLATWLIVTSLSQLVFSPTPVR